MHKLNLPEYDFSIRNGQNVIEIFDGIRKKYVALTPEEWVRQNFIRYLIEERDYPKSLMAIEKELIVNKLKKRCDIVVYNRQLIPILIVECKAFNVKINQQAFDQAARYNLSLNVKNLIITNGLSHYCCLIEENKEAYTFIKDIPNFKDIS